MLEPGKCHRCGADIVWMQTLSGNVMPVDPEPSTSGELTVICGRIQPPMGQILDEIYGPERYTSHVRTCAKRPKPKKGTAS